MPTYSNRRRTTTKRTTTSARFGRTGGGKSYGYTAGTTTRKTTTRKGPAAKAAAPGYQNVNSAFEWKVRSFRTLWDQTRGPAKYGRPSPATLKTFANWINKGAYVWRVTNTQVNKWCKTNQQYKTGTSVKTVLGGKFGKSTIKAVACDKSGGFIVATAPTYKGKPFNFPH